MERKRQLLVLALVILAGVSVWRAIWAEAERRRIDHDYTHMRQDLSHVQQEYAHLNEELTGARQTIDGQATDVATLQSTLGNLQSELRRLQQRLDETVNEMALLRQENEQLHLAESSLNTELSTAKDEKRKLEEQWSSLTALKQAIRDVKRELWRKRWAAWRGQIQTRKNEQAQQLAMGNHGYVVREGKSTLAGTTRLRVTVLEPEPGR